MELTFNPCGEFLLTFSLVSLESFKVCSGAKERKWGEERNGKLPHLFIPNKTANLVPEFAVEDLPLNRTRTLGPAFAVKDLLLGSVV